MLILHQSTSRVDVLIECTNPCPQRSIGGAERKQAINLVSQGI